MRTEIAEKYKSESENFIEEETALVLYSIVKHGTVITFGLFLCHLFDLIQTIFCRSTS